MNKKSFEIVMDALNGGGGRNIYPETFSKILACTVLNLNGLNTDFKWISNPL